MKQKCEAIYKKIKYRFNDPQLLQTALTHRSANRSNNERLEFLGDGVLNCIVGWQLYEFYPKADEGVLSRYRAALVREKTLADVARSLELGDLLVLGPGELKSGGNRRDSILADGFEAVIGAVYVDDGFEHCIKIIRDLFQTRIEKLAELVELKDPKTRLQEYLQAQRLPLPEYTLVKVGGAAHTRHFVIECKIPSLALATQGEGSSRRRAEQEAAERVLEKIENE